MTEDAPGLQRISVAQAKRTFADLLGAVRHRRARFVVERRGTPMAAIVPVDEVIPEGGEQGFLALVGAFEDAPELADVLDGIVGDRSRQRKRPPPRLPA